jgi:hypothetical protein
MTANDSRLDSLARIVADDPLATAGLVVDFSIPIVTLAQFNKAVIAKEWRGYARIAFDRRMFLVAAGRPFRANARGFYALAADAATVPAAVLAANARMGDIGLSATLWTILAHDDLRAILGCLLANAGGTEGNA